MRTNWDSRLETLFKSYKLVVRHWCDTTEGRKLWRIHCSCWNDVAVFSIVTNRLLVKIEELLVRGSTSATLAAIATTSTAPWLFDAWLVGANCVQSLNNLSPFCLPVVDVIIRSAFLESFEHRCIFIHNLFHLAFACSFIWRSCIVSLFPFAELNRLARSKMRDWVLTRDRVVSICKDVGHSVEHLLIFFFNLCAAI